MLKTVTFYLIEQADDYRHDELSPHEKVACDKVIEHWKNKTRIFVACQDQQQAERVDEYIWQQSVEDFVPHNLVGEGLKGGSPVEIGWQGKRGNGNRQLLINLQEDFPDVASVYRNIIDFVPVEARLKDLARERYKTYRNIGFNLKTIKV